jgi:hypothetical protein
MLIGAVTGASIVTAADLVTRLSARRSEEAAAVAPR